MGMWGVPVDDDSGYESTGATATRWRGNTPVYDRGKAVCVIGAGASGLAAVKNLLEQGFAVDCYERETGVGGLWNWRQDRSPVYASTHLISSRAGSGYPDFPMPDDWPDYPHHTKVHAYLERYAEHFGLREHIWFGTEVVRVVPAGDHWDVTTRVGEGERSSRYAAVVVANGHHWSPKLPRYDGLSVAVREAAQLTAEGFGGILAVGGGSSRPPRLVELSWRPPGADTHVVLVGKGITFDTGGICIKPREGMKLMRKDMGGAAAVTAATIGAAALGLPVQVTALAPMAENAVSGNAARPGDVIRHYGGMTTEVLNTDAEGRLVLADALAYAVEHLAPDALVDVATLTGATSVALGKRTAALYSGSDTLAEALAEAGAAVGEPVWRMPLVDDYVEALGSDVADLVNATDVGGGSLMAALFLREFTGEARDRWAHLDMSAPAWSDSADGVLAKGATGWGVRSLLRWLESFSG